MPRLRLRLAAGMVAMLAAACSAPTGTAPPASTPTPSVPAASPLIVSHNWTQNLVFSGEVSGTMRGIVPSGPGQVSECTGRNSAAGGAWASAIFGSVGADTYGVVVVAKPYRGPGIYRDGQVSVQVHSPDSSRVWQSAATGPVTFTVAADESSGTLDASLLNLATGRAGLKVTGPWTCN